MEMCILCQDFQCYSSKGKIQKSEIWGQEERGLLGDPNGLQPITQVVKILTCNFIAENLSKSHLSKKYLCLQAVVIIHKPFQNHPKFLSYSLSLIKNLFFKFQLFFSKQSYSTFNRNFGQVTSETKYALSSTHFQLSSDQITPAKSTNYHAR